MGRLEVLEGVFEGMVLVICHLKGIGGIDGVGRGSFGVVAAAAGIEGSLAVAVAVVEVERM